MSPEKDAATSLTLTRQLDASREAVWAAWTDGESMKRWMRPGPGMTVPVADLDVQVGGRYRIVMAGDDAEYEHVGEYLEVEEPSRLRFTWSSPATQHQATMVTVELAESEGGTHLTLTHERFPSEEATQQHEQGWSTILDALDRVLGG